MPTLKLETVIRGDRRAVFDLLKKQEEFPSFMADVEEILILKRTPDELVTEWHALLDEAPVEWTQDNAYDDETCRLSFKGYDGDFDRWEGEWRLDPEGDAVRATLVLDYLFDLPTLQDLLSPVIERKVRHNAERLLSGLKDRVEGTSAGAPAGA